MTDHLAIVRAELQATRPLRDLSDAQPEDDLFDDLALDSLDRVTVAIALEEALGLDLPDSVVSKWRTVGDIVRTVRR